MPTYLPAIAGTYDQIAVDPAMQTLMTQGGVGVTNALSAPGMQMPQPAISRIQQEMQNYGRVGAARNSLAYETARGQMDAAQQSRALAARAQAALAAHQLNQQMFANQYQRQQQYSSDGQAMLMKLLSPFMGQMMNGAF